MAEVSRKTGVNIVASTGIYTFDELPPFFAGRDVDVMTAAFVHDITVGIQETPILAGSSSVPPTRRASPQGSKR